jgi:hypothetical protein
MRDLSVRLSTQESNLAEAQIEVTDPAYTGCKISAANSSERRIVLERFSRYDCIAIAYDKPIAVEILDSRAVPLHGPVRKYIGIVDYMVIGVLICVLLMFVAEPLKEFLAPSRPRQQTQDGSNAAFQNLLFAIVMAMTFTAGAVVAAVVLVPGRARMFLGRQKLDVPARASPQKP